MTLPRCVNELPSTRSTPHASLSSDFTFASYPCARIPLLTRCWSLTNRISSFQHGAPSSRLHKTPADSFTILPATSASRNTRPHITLNPRKPFAGCQTARCSLTAIRATAQSHNHDAAMVASTESMDS